MSDANERFEAIGDLYYLRYGVLRPGKSDMFRDSSSEENRARFDNWFATHAFLDAIDEIIKLEKRIEKLESA